MESGSPGISGDELERLEPQAAAIVLANAEAIMVPS